MGDAACTGRLEAPGPAVVEWLMCADAAGGPEGELLALGGAPHPPAKRAGLDVAGEAANEAAVAEEFAAMRFFENTHSLDLQARSAGRGCTARAGDEAVHLFDRVGRGRVGSGVTGHRRVCCHALLQECAPPGSPGALYCVGLTCDRSSAADLQHHMLLQ